MRERSALEYPMLKACVIEHLRCVGEHVFEQERAGHRTPVGLDKSSPVDLDTPASIAAGQHR